MTITADRGSAPIAWTRALSAAPLTSSPHSRFPISAARLRRMVLAALGWVAALATVVVVGGMVTHGLTAGAGGALTLSPVSGLTMSQPDPTPR